MLLPCYFKLSVTSSCKYHAGIPMPHQLCLYAALQCRVTLLSMVSHCGTLWRSWYPNLCPLQVELRIMLTSPPSGSSIENSVLSSVTFSLQLPVATDVRTPGQLYSKRLHSYCHPNKGYYSGDSTVKCNLESMISNAVIGLLKNE